MSELFSRIAIVGLFLLIPVVLLWAAPDKAVAFDRKPEGETVKVHVFAADGELVGPVDMPVLDLTPDEWRERLTEEQFRILRKSGTEAPFCGNLLDNKKEGVYCCAGCGLPLFASDSKFTSGTGWPSFFKPVGEGNVTFKEDLSLGMRRIEICCARCGGHLGHVFPDGPEPTGLRFCVNSESLKFVEQTELSEIQEVEQMVIAGGCFWCVEAVFESINGIVNAESGFAGDTREATYKDVVSGKTDHAEAVRLTYLPSVISAEKILEIHFATHNPTTLNRQGADVGRHYRSALFYRNDAEKQLFESFIASKNASGEFADPIVTTLEPNTPFVLAEDYHQDYAEKNPDQGYIRAVAVPKVKKAEKAFPELLKPKAESEKP